MVLHLLLLVIPRNNSHVNFPGVTQCWIFYIVSGKIGLLIATFMKVFQRFSKHCSCHLNSKIYGWGKGSPYIVLALEVGWEVSDVIGLRNEVLSNGEGHAFQKKEKNKYKIQLTFFKQHPPIQLVFCEYSSGEDFSYIEGLREEVKPCFGQSVFMAEVLVMFCNSDGFPDGVGLIGLLDVAYDFRSVDTVFHLNKVFSYHKFSRLVYLICFKILMDM